jgi:hypothetical protein
MEKGINSKIDLYNRIKPAINVKIKDIKREYSINITVNEIFSYLENNIWNKKINLSLSEMVEDIFNIDINELFKSVEKRRQSEEETL